MIDTVANICVFDRAEALTTKTGIGSGQNIRKIYYNINLHSKILRMNYRHSTYFFLNLIINYFKSFNLYQICISQITFTSVFFELSYMSCIAHTRIKMQILYLAEKYLMY